MGNSLDKLKDAHLWKCFKTGNREAMQIIYFRHYTILLNYGKKLTTNEEIAEDCIQDLFYKLWKNRENLGDVISIRSYLYKSYRRILFDLVKAHRKYSTVSDLPTEYDIVLSIEHETIQEEHLSDRHHGLKQAMKGLSKRQREIIYLCFYRGFTYDEIAEIISIKNQTIRNCVYEAIKVLRNHLQKTPS